DGLLRQSGTFGNQEADVRDILLTQFRDKTEKWKTKRLVLYAHGGLVDESSAVQRVADLRGPMLDNQVYPLSLIWKSGYWTTLTNLLQDALRRRRPEGFLDSAKDFLLDRLDDALEPLARQLTGKAEWDEMKREALGATINQAGGARIVAELIQELVSSDP